MAVSAADAAQRLLGCILERTMHDGRVVRVKIVETEAYDQTDAASHSYTGRTPRTDVMFSKPGHLYVYFTYGMHYCCNIVVGPPGYGAAVLIRAVEPLDGVEILESYRPRRGIELTNGPAKLCQALAITTALNGHDVRQPPLRLVLQPVYAPAEITQTTRVGIKKAPLTPWRFYITSSPYVSRKDESSTV